VRLAELLSNVWWPLLDLAAAAVAAVIDPARRRILGLSIADPCFTSSLLAWRSVMETLDISTRSPNLKLFACCCLSFLSADAAGEFASAPSNVQSSASSVISSISSSRAIRKPSHASSRCGHLLQRPLLRPYASL
jgi:hypothetical protein